MGVFHFDKPISKEGEDHFQRYEFSKRIASLIDKDKFYKSLVVGIYGKWGEGKSSVLNFIAAELTPNTVKIDFNPWYFQDETNLIKAFFEAVSQSLGKKLKSKKEKIAKAFEDYSDSLGGIAGLAIPYGKQILDLGKAVTSKFKDDSLEHYKSRVEKLIIESEANFVVFIDDIDRLNIDEIQAVFKLVKLVGDFPRFSYVLAFDDDLVAASLGHQFGDGGKKDGYSFLEKIIQLPLHLPKPNDFALRKYSLDLIDAALESIQISLTPKETEDFLGKYDMAFVPGLKSPRLGIRFANSIAFSIPLLKGEVNLSDLLIIEGVKIFYPELYYFIRQNPDIFLRNYNQSDLTPISNTELKQQAYDKLDQELKKFEPSLGNKIRNMLTSLFPLLNGVYRASSFANNAYDNWYKEKRICSFYYFERYFSYVVKDGDISDVYFNELFSDLGKLSIADFSMKLIEELPKLNISDFIFKLKRLYDSFSEAEAKRLCLVLASIGTMIPDTRIFGIETLRDEMARIVRLLIDRLKGEDKLAICKEAISIAKPYNYALSLYYKFSYRPSRIDEDSFLTKDEIVQISDIMVEKFINETKRVKPFIEYPDVDLNSTFQIFITAGKKDMISRIVLNELNANYHLMALKLIKIFTPTHYSTAKTSLYKSVFSEDDYNFMSEIIDPTIVYDKIIPSHGDSTSKVLPFYESDSELSDGELIGLFQQIHLSRTKKED